MILSLFAGVILGSSRTYAAEKCQAIFDKSPSRERIDDRAPLLEPLVSPARPGIRAQRLISGPAGSKLDQVLQSTRVQFQKINVEIEFIYDPDLALRGAMMGDLSAYAIGSRSLGVILGPIGFAEALRGVTLTTLLHEIGHARLEALRRMGKLPLGGAYEALVYFAETSRAKFVFDSYGHGYLLEEIKMHRRDLFELLKAYEKFSGEKGVFGELTEQISQKMQLLSDLIHESDLILSAARSKVQERDWDSIEFDPSSRGMHIYWGDRKGFLQLTLPDSSTVNANSGAKPGVLSKLFSKFHFGLDSSIPKREDVARESELFLSRLLMAVDKEKVSFERLKSKARKLGLAF